MSVGAFSGFLQHLPAETVGETPDWARSVTGGYGHTYQPELPLVWPNTPQPIGVHNPPPHIVGINLRLGADGRWRWLDDTSGQRVAELDDLRQAAHALQDMIAKHVQDGGTPTDRLRASAQGRGLVR